jgi:hypothetical protein
VNYTPLYYLINGVALNRTNLLGSVFTVSPAPAAGASASGSVLVRFVNAGLRMRALVVGPTTGTPAVSGFR